MSYPTPTNSKVSKDQRKARRLSRKADIARALESPGEPLVYVLLTKGGLFAKVGVSSNLPRRIKSVQTGCPLIVEPRYVYFCKSREHAFECEAAILDALENHRGAGEWIRWPQAKPELKRLDFIEPYGGLSFGHINEIDQRRVHT